MKFLSNPVLGHIAKVTCDVVGDSKQIGRYICQPSEEPSSSFASDKDGRLIVLIVVLILAAVVAGIKFL
ncbi:MAG: hypothetical protein WAW13_04715 [Minisyncoccia bacterium]